MLIDWFTVAAQIVNFLVLVWLLKRYLYQPILKSIDAREQIIAARLRDAEGNKADAARERDLFRQKSQEIDRQRADLLQQAAAQADAEHQRLLVEVRHEADQRRAQWQASLESDAEHFRQTLISRSQEEVFAMARQALRDLADADIQQRMVEVLARRLRELSARDAAHLQPLLRAQQPLSVRSAWGLTSTQRAVLEQVLRDLGYTGPLECRVDPAVMAGIELSGNGYKISWTVADYLTSLRAAVDALTAVRPEGAAPSAPS
jgi:F-type H+-transporting ATPase subunit b